MTTEGLTIVFHTAMSYVVVSTNVVDLIFLPMLYIWAHISILSYVKMLSHAKDLIPNICGQHLNNLEFSQILIQYSYILHQFIFNKYLNFITLS